MKNDPKPFLWAYLAIACLGWALTETLLLLSGTGLNYLVPSLVGLMVGSVMGALLAGTDGFLSQNPWALKSGIKFGGILGGIGGLVGFFMSQQGALQLGELPIEATNLILAQKWLVLAVLIGTGMGLAEQSNKAVSRGVLAGLVAGGATSLFSGLAAAFFPWPVGLRGLSLFFLVLSFLVARTKLRGTHKGAWLISLNGRNEGARYELNKSLYHLGTQSSDEINLESYKDINSTHAKLIWYECGYSLVDNDPFCRTYVNFRNIDEQPLKTGDIVKIGSALFQYSVS
ncbi:MAG: hypothetical protein A2527_08515 [Candidatus Lambdaproteobacteria bacterium RIFOXYD2_FULL_50_16]|uniref:FHA domain-containing protein n=1 Tax=Candidatus Lambdaproteobacteria bacterium RIFOXYD2_FULL_50_16 TaxID=1817772 RepID=A0A1F6GAR4_9PROT|nr:MAG: hypothetical protein A2527_08515 [Candidatus Lambdaproteobacteria bacterium RIFOXYD2_FULL_50_16]